MRHALEGSLSLRRPVLAVVALFRLALALNLLGCRGEAEAWCRRVLADFGWEEGSFLGGPAHVAWRLGVLRLEANDLVEATHELERAWSGLGSGVDAAASAGRRRHSASATCLRRRGRGDRGD